MTNPLTIRTNQRNGLYYVIVADNGRWLLNRGPFLNESMAMNSGRDWAREYALAILRAIGPDMPYNASCEGETCMDMAERLNESCGLYGAVHAI